MVGNEKNPSIPLPIRNKIEGGTSGRGREEYLLQGSIPAGAAFSWEMLIPYFVHIVAIPSRPGGEGATGTYLLGPTAIDCLLGRGKGRKTFGVHLSQRQKENPNRSFPSLYTNRDGKGLLVVRIKRKQSGAVLHSKKRVLVSRGKKRGRE